MDKPGIPLDFFNFTRKVVLVTGSGHGLGKGIARRFAQAGAEVAVHYRSNGEEAHTLVNELKDAGKHIEAFQADIAERDEAAKLVKTVIGVFGHLDILINNAGSYPVSSLVEMPVEQWDEVLNSNLRGLHLCTQSAAREMMSRGKGGSVINIASVEAFAPGAAHSHYSAAKAGVVEYTRAAAFELGRHHIRVNAVSPGLIWREGLDRDWPQGVNSYLEKAPLGRLGMPEDIADACMFLASEGARWITGANLVVDGGILARPSF
jgi:NAD(P)-dependent dehydrogenase (short-subunit alcohol dehydrogenase family)